MRKIQQMPDTTDLKVWAEWLVATCLLFGCSVGTAYKVTAIFIEGIEHERREASSR